MSNRAWAVILGSALALSGLSACWSSSTDPSSSSLSDDYKKDGGMTCSKPDGAMPEEDAGADCVCTSPMDCGGRCKVDAGPGEDEEGGPCTLTQGYWKNHPDAWPVTSLTLGGVSYTEAELITILQTSVSGDASLILAHQLIAAELNVAAGVTAGGDVSTAIADADAWLGANADADGRLPYAIAPSSTAGAAAVSLGATLDAFNEGRLGTSHCGDASDDDVDDGDMPGDMDDGDLD